MSGITNIRIISRNAGPRALVCEPADALVFGQETVAMALEQDVDGFASQTLKSLPGDLTGTVRAILTTFQGGTYQLVHRVDLEGRDLSFIVKSSKRPGGTAFSDRDPHRDRRPHAQRDFTHFEYLNLRGCAALCSDLVLSPLALARVGNGEESVYVYSQPHLANFLEVNPTRQSDGWPCTESSLVQGWRFVTDNPDDLLDMDKHVLSALDTQAVVKATIKGAALIYLKSWGRLLPFPSYPQGDVMVEKGNWSNPKWVGIISPFFPPELFVLLKKMHHGFFWEDILDHEMLIYALQMINFDNLNRPPYFRGEKFRLDLDYQDAFVAGVSEAFDLHFGQQKHNFDPSAVAARFLRRDKAAIT